MPNTTQGLDVPAVLAQLTLEETAALLDGAYFWRTTPIERLGVPGLLLSDGPHGLRKQVEGGTTSGSPAASRRRASTVIAFAIDAVPRVAFLGSACDRHHASRGEVHGRCGQLHGLELGAQLIQESRDTDHRFDVGDREAVHAGRPGPGVARDPVERHDQRRRVVHKVEQVVEPAARIGRRLSVKFGLNLRYPPTWPDWRRRRGADVRRRVLSALQPPSLLRTAAALRPVTGSPGLRLLRRLRPAPDRSADGGPNLRPPRRKRGGR
jgi:hypothetical protein